MATQVRASEMTSKQFNGLLTKITNTGRTLDKLIAQGIAYCAAQHINHGNKNPWQRLRDAAPVFARKIIDDARKACANVDRADDEALHEVEETAALQLEERRTKGAKRKVKKAESAPASTDHLDTGARVEQYQLVHFNGSEVEKLQLTQAEYEAAMAAVHALRAKASKPKAVKADKKAA